MYAAECTDLISGLQMIATVVLPGRLLFSFSMVIKRDPLFRCKQLFFSGKKKEEKEKVGSDVRCLTTNEVKSKPPKCSHARAFLQYHIFGSHKAPKSVLATSEKEEGGALQKDVAARYHLTPLKCINGENDGAFFVTIRQV